MKNGRVVAVATTAAVACLATARIAALFRKQATASIGDAGQNGEGLHAHAAVTVRGTPEQVYAKWRDLPRLPSVLTHLSSVAVLDQQRSRWTAVADGERVTWDAEIVDDVPGRELAWRSLPPARWPTQGRVRFSPVKGGTGTEVHLDLSYATSPRGPAPFDAGSKEIQRDLDRFKRTVDAH